MSLFLLINSVDTFSTNEAIKSIIRMIIYDDFLVFVYILSTLSLFIFMIIFFYYLLNTCKKNSTSKNSLTPNLYEESEKSDCLIV